MAWPLIIFAAASAVYSGVSASNTSKANAAAAQNAANANANSVRNSARISNQANSMIAMFNASSSLASAKVNTQANQDLANYNSLLITSTNAYNQELLSQELSQIWENEGLDKVYLEQRRSEDTGKVVASQASSGTTIGVGSNQDTYVDLQAQYALQQTVLVQQYDRQANSVLNAQARGNWETQQQITKLQYETQMGSYVTMSNAYADARSGLMSSAVSSWANTESANNQANTYISGGNAQFSAYQSQASQQMTAGVVNGIGAAASTYAQTYQPTTPQVTQTYNTGRVLPASSGQSSSLGSMLA